MEKLRNIEDAKYWGMTLHRNSSVLSWRKPKEEQEIALQKDNSAHWNYGIFFIQYLDADLQESLGCKQQAHQIALFEYSFYPKAEVEAHATAAFKAYINRVAGREVPESEIIRHVGKRSTKEPG